jgi:hypothetical protein
VFPSDDIHISMRAATLGGNHNLGHVATVVATIVKRAPAPMLDVLDK